MLGVCFKLGKMTGIDPVLFQVIFVIWFIHNPVALFWYFLLSLIL